MLIGLEYFKFRTKRCLNWLYPFPLSPKQPQVVALKDEKEYTKVVLKAVQKADCVSCVFWHPGRCQVLAFLPRLETFTRGLLLGKLNALRKKKTSAHWGTRLGGPRYDFLKDGVYCVEAAASSARVECALFWKMRGQDEAHRTMRVPTDPTDSNMHTNHAPYGQ